MSGLTSAVSAAVGAAATAGWSNLKTRPSSRPRASVASRPASMYVKELPFPGACLTAGGAGGKEGGTKLRDPALDVRRAGLARDVLLSSISPSTRPRDPLGLTQSLLINQQQGAEQWSTATSSYTPISGTTPTERAFELLTLVAASPPTLLTPSIVLATPLWGGTEHVHLPLVETKAQNLGVLTRAVTALVDAAEELWPAPASSSPSGSSSPSTGGIAMAAPGLDGSGPEGVQALLDALDAVGDALKQAQSIHQYHTGEFLGEGSPEYDFGPPPPNARSDTPSGGGGSHHKGRVSRLTRLTHRHERTAAPTATSTPKTTAAAAVGGAACKPKPLARIAASAYTEHISALTKAIPTLRRHLYALQLLTTSTPSTTATHSVIGVPGVVQHELPSPATPLKEFSTAPYAALSNEGKECVRRKFDKACGVYRSFVVPLVLSDVRIILLGRLKEGRV